jgi:hypothetical protein
MLRFLTKSEAKSGGNDVWFHSRTEIRGGRCGSYSDAGGGLYLHNAAEIAGTFGAASASIAIVGGAKVARFQKKA